MIILNFLTISQEVFNYILIIFISNWICHWIENCNCLFSFKSSNKYLSLTYKLNSVVLWRNERNFLYRLKVSRAEQQQNPKKKIQKKIQKNFRKFSKKKFFFAFFISKSRNCEEFKKWMPKMESRICEDHELWNHEMRGSWIT